MTPAWPAPVLLLITLLALRGSVALTLQPGTASLGAFLSADFGLLGVPGCTVLFAPLIGQPSFFLCRAGLRLAAMAAVGFIVAWLHGSGSVDNPYFATAGLGLTGAAFLASDLVAPVCRRRSACARAIGSFRPGIAALSKGFRPIGAVVHERLRSALSDLDGNASNRSHAAPVRDELQRHTWNALRGELQRLQVPGDALPVLGRSVGSDHDQAARVSAFGLFEADLAMLPRVLQAAVTLDGLAAAVCALDGIAVVLPLAAPDNLTAPPAGREVGGDHAGRTGTPPWAF